MVHLLHRLYGVDAPGCRLALTQVCSSNITNCQHHALQHDLRPWPMTLMYNDLRAMVMTCTHMWYTQLGVAYSPSNFISSFLFYIRKPWAIVWRCLCDPLCNCSDTIPTDGHTTTANTALASHRAVRTTTTTVNNAWPCDKWMMLCSDISRPWRHFIADWARAPINDQCLQFAPSFSVA